MADKRFSYQELQEKLNDKTFLKNLRTIIIIIIVIGVPLLYFGLFGSITLETLLSWKLGGLAIMSIGLVTLIRIDTKSRAFDDEINANKKLNEIENEIINKTKLMNNHIIGRKFVKYYNLKEQKEADENKTEYAIETLKQKISFMEIKGKFGKRYNKLKNRILELEKHPLHDKIKPIVYDELYNFNSKRLKKQASSKQKLTYNPKKENVVSSAFNVFMKGAGIGGAGSLPFIIGEDIQTIMAFYFALFITVLITVLQSYIKTRYHTANRYMETRVFKLQLLNECIDYIKNYDLKETNSIEQKLILDTYEPPKLLIKTEAS